MTNATYNGWTNWATWNFMNYYGDVIAARHEELEADAHKHGDYDTDRIEEKLTHYVEGIIEIAIDEMPATMGEMAKDFLFHAYREIDVEDIVHTTMQ